MLNTPVTFKDSNEFYKMQEFYSERFYEFYVKHSKLKKKMTLYRAKRIIKKFFLVLYRHFLNNQAGVFIKNFGYFFISRRPERKVLRYNINGKVFYSKALMNLGAHYQPSFLPIRKDASFSQWSMDRAFTNALKRRLRKFTNENRVNYRCALTILHKFYGRTNREIKLPKKKQNDNN